jgi:Cu-processing system permease protein
MKPVFVLAFNSYREFLREKVVLASILVSVLLILLSLTLGELTFSEGVRVLVHFGLTSMQLAGLVVAFFFGANVLHKEMEKQTCLVVLARPIDRGQFVLGKILGVILLLLLIDLILLITLGLLVRQNLGNLFQIGVGIFLEQCIIATLAFFASSLFRPAVALFFAFGFFVAGNWIQDVKFFFEKVKALTELTTIQWIDRLVPNFYQMNWRSIYFLENGIPSYQFYWSLAHALSWLTLMSLLSIYSFRKKDLV